MKSLHQAAYDVIMCHDFVEKCRLSREVEKAWQDGELCLESESQSVTISEPGRPIKPELVEPQQVPRRSINSEKGRLALIHAITHIEFNAINLAWDAVYRFRGHPKAYYDDWISVASDETRHFEMLRDYLTARGADYGDFSAHNGLWEMAVKTDHDVMTRMALVPRVLEARGLDVTPDMMAKLQKANDVDAVARLEVILREEINHVRIGSRWYHHFCDQRQLNRQSTFIDLVNEYMKGMPRGPFNIEARLMAGFEQDELDYISGSVK